MNSPTSGPRPDGQKQALYEAAVAAVQEAGKRNRKSPEGARWGRRITMAGALVVVSFGLYLLLARPAWFVTPPPEPESVQVQEASVRLMLVREVARIRSEAGASGRLPDGFDGTGSSARSIRYQRLTDSTFLVAATVGTRELILRSTDSTAAFLGNSLATVSNRVGR